MTTTPPSPWDDLTIPPHARKRGVTLNLYDQLSAYVPKRPGAYLRISSDRFGLEAGVDRQNDDAEDTRARLGWAPFAKVYRENDTSAFKKRKVIRPDGSIDWVVLRPKFRQLLADLADGVIDGVIFYDLDRLVRQPRDLEDLIDIVEYVQHPVVGATGGRMNLINDNDRHMARMMCVMALKSSEDTARRVARMHLAAAQQGKVQGRIAYGWIRSGPDKGRHLPEEAGVVRALFAGCLIGETAYSLAAGLNARGIPAPQADRWSSTTVNKMLRNPRYAGMASYGGKHRIEPALEWDGWSHVLFDDDGHPLLGNWDPIIDPKDWSRVQFELQLRRQASGIPAGSSRPPVTPKYLLSGILRCGKCGRGLVSNLDRKKKYRTYRCPPSAHGGCGGIHIAAGTTEKAVERALTTYFEQLLATMRHQHRHDDTAPDTQLINTRSALAAEHARKQDLMRRWADNTLAQTALTEDDFFQLIHAINKKIATLQDLLAAAEASTPTTAPPPDADQWLHGTVNQRRTLIRRYLHGITVQPAPKAHVFNRTHIVHERLQPHWRTAEELAA
ncbi:recombinase family protein [Actinacidiphila sp. bgisy144]|uniref:recombinase family protein n=1 Tax=Actinacidiphila sp. bgisy144 TaxID=3413791 RepID=UPI003EB8B196